jgi:hypothetical protein
MSREVTDANELKLSTAIMQAIHDHSLTEIDGEPSAIINPLDAANALVNCLATILESSPTCNTPKGMHETAEEIGKGLHRLMRDTRTMREAGHPRFPAEVFYTN